MAPEQEIDPTESRYLWQQRLLRIYFSGIVALALVLLAWIALNEFTPWFDQFDNPFVAFGLAVAVLIVVPPVFGIFIQFALNPILGRWSTWNELVRLEERLAGELTNRAKPRIVIANVPSPQERTVGVMTKTFPGRDGPELGAVYIPYGPKSSGGYIRIIPVTELEVTDWTLREFQLYQLTVGAVSPAELLPRTDADRHEGAKVE